MFWVAVGASSGETTVFLQQLVLVILYAGAYAPAYQTVIHTE